MRRIQTFILSMTIIFSAAIFGADADESDRLHLGTGTWQLGGELSVPALWKSSTDYTAEMKARIHGGYFVLAGFEIRLTVGFSQTWSSSYFEEDPLRLKLGLGLFYYLDLDSVFKPFIGTEAGLDSTPDGSFVETLLGDAHFSLGTLIELNRYVALSVATIPYFRYTLRSGVDTYGWDILNVGIEVFF